MLLKRDNGALIHEQALVESQAVGAGTRVWAFAHILPGAVVGQDCNICDHTFLENDIVIGDRLTPQQLLRTTIKKGASIGANATILPGLTIGERAMVGAGAVVTRNVPPDSIVAGNPAKIVGYVGTSNYE